ncbi:uncharacterized protein MELLADRAFT_63019 [Melampsora larici-populina 98AG31]|uniref:Secreted protein n=1 Tax=Melampsora larici-populina (strain 98AG31 / pathotype 3-4-7) TaxID=747676 RepID=F4RKZ8_MELLP|nr:uncharacterized protein MELLADRAFT_63019 [Melampsora larici-populina 98AG31]EGG06812.1 hypothetical protein MELLADRAFT_63019 [Melampsora larici-populina 98AG31]
MRVSISFVLLTLAVIASSEVKTRPANEVARQNLGSLQEPRLMTRCDSCGSKSATDASTYGGSKGDTVVDSRSSTSADQSTPGSTPPASVSKVPGSSNADTQAATKKDTSTLDSGKAQAAGTATTDQAGGTTQADNKVDGTDTPSDTGTAAQTLDSQNSQNTSSSKTTANQSAANTVPGGLADQKSESTPDTQQTTGTQSTPSGATGRTQLAQSADSTSNNGAQYGQNNQQAIDTSTTTQSRDTTRSYQGLVESCQQLLPRFIRFTQIVSRPDVDYNSALQEFASIRSQFEEIVKTYSSCGGGCAQNQDLLSVVGVPGVPYYSVGFI